MQGGAEMETKMTRLVSVVIVAGLAVPAAAPAFADPAVCLTVKNIKSSDVAKDGTSVTFEMRDGKIWRNDLQGSCPDAWFNGFAWTVHADTVCDNEPGMKVLQSGQICTLGKFTAMTPAPRG